MIASIRREYNNKFTTEKYYAFLRDLDARHPGAIDFRLAETPVFVPKDFAKKMIDACENIIDLLMEPSFMKATENSIPPTDKVAGSYGYPQTLVFDFGVCHDGSGGLTPMLVEMQGFPSMYAFQSVLPPIMGKHLWMPSSFTPYLGGLDESSYVELLKRTLLGKFPAENVVLLEIKPDEQKTRVDFYDTRDLTGISPVCVTELISHGRNIFYKKEGREIKIERIYNRMIFDEFHSRPDLETEVDIRKDLNVEWAPHPDWFYRLSKYTLPLISHPHVPETYFLNELKQLPGNLSEFVLKPLFSFAGQGVVIDITREDIERINDPHNWILQRKVHYADIIETPDGKAKTEIRIMYLWEDNKPRPVPAINLARISKGKMIGTRYNKDKDWVGGTVALFEP